MDRSRKFRMDHGEQVVTCGQSWMPDEGHGVPEHEGGVDPGLGGVHVIGPILALAHLHLHELGDVESEGDGCHRDDVGQDPPGLRHGL